MSALLYGYSNANVNLCITTRFLTTHVILVLTYTIEPLPSKILLARRIYLESFVTLMEIFPEIIGTKESFSHS